MSQIAVRPNIDASYALGLAEKDALSAYKDLSPFSIRVDLEEDGWHIDYELKKRGMAGGGPHYVIDAVTGEIISKRYEQ